MKQAISQPEIKAMQSEYSAANAGQLKRKRFCADFETTVSGIPCGIRIDNFFYQKPQPWNDASDWDCEGGCEIEFSVLDLKGYEAPWIQKKLTPSDILRIELKIIDECEES